MKAKIIVAVVSAVVALLIGNQWGAHAQQGTLGAARDSLAAALTDAGRQKNMVDFLTTRASLAEARADAESARADSLAHVSQKALIRYTSVKATAPDTCALVIAAADSAISTAQAEAEAARNGLRSAQDAAKDYKAARDTALAALARLSVAAGAVQVASAPSWRERVIPRFGVGATIGVNPATGRPAMAAGLTIGWQF